MDLGFNLAQSNRDLKDLTSRQIFGDTSGLLCKNDLIPCLIPFPSPFELTIHANFVLVFVFVFVIVFVYLYLYL